MAETNGNGKANTLILIFGLLLSVLVQAGIGFYFVGGLKQEVDDLRHDFTQLEDRFNKFVDGRR